ncbi:MAG: hypothetical protein K2X32_05240 [Phycisphaerales bacterium]|nr:hypothetical protein [Phycisphaerales bacterium]
MLYSAIWAVVCGVFSLGARAPAVWRARRGRCRACGYDRRGLLSMAVCPECGLVPPARDSCRDGAPRKVRVPRWSVWWWARGAAMAFVLGVLTNVLVAWACLYRSQRVDANVWELFSVAPMEYPTASSAAWVGVESVVWPLPGAMSGFARQTNPRGEIPRSVLDAIDAVRRSRGVAAREADIVIDELVMVGWPWLAFSCDARVTLSLQTRRISSDVVRGGWLPVGRAPFLIPVPHLISSPLLVYRPVSPGFVWNTALFSMTWVGIWGCCIGAVGLSRLGRARVGQCRRCGYDRSGLASAAVCPECGKGA